MPLNAGEREKNRNTNNHKDSADEHNRNTKPVTGYPGQATASDNLLATVKSLGDQNNTLLKEFPKELKMKVIHNLEGQKTKWVLLTGVILCLVSITSVTTSFNLWSRNNRLHEHDVEFRMIRQRYPNLVMDIEALYFSNPKGMEAETQRQESRAMAIALAQAAAEQSKQEAEQAKRKLNKLKRDK